MKWKRLVWMSAALVATGVGGTSCRSSGDAARRAAPREAASMRATPEAGREFAATPVSYTAGAWNPGSPSGGRVRLGIDVIESAGFAPLRGKRVGLITNQTSVNGRGMKTREVLHRAREVNLVALFVPEHGLDGAEKAGEHIRSRRDPVTGLTAYSLYGDTRKPTPEMLRNLDVLVFDLQDIGSRSYTYISTMILAMRACAERGMEFMVLDRPNPLGGERVQGPPVEEQWISFVGQVPVPYLHGMTAGELARMAVGEGWVPPECRLTVIRMEGWDRSMTWEATGLRWVATSPNIPNARSPFYYAATGIFGSLTGGDIGIGTAGPFEYAGARGIDAEEFTRRLNSLRMPGVQFTPYKSGNRPGYEGSRLHIDPRAGADLVAINVAVIHELNARMPRSLWSTTPTEKMTLFRKVYGSTDLEREMKAGTDPGRIIASWRPYNERFARQRAPYLLYGGAPKGGLVAARQERGSGRG